MASFEGVRAEKPRLIGFVRHFFERFFSRLRSRPLRRASAVLSVFEARLLPLMRCARGPFSPRPAENPRAISLPRAASGRRMPSSAISPMARNIGYHIAGDLSRGRRKRGRRSPPSLRARRLPRPGGPTRCEAPCTSLAAPSRSLSPCAATSRESSLLEFAREAKPSLRYVDLFDACPVSSLVVTICNDRECEPRHQPRCAKQDHKRGQQASAGRSACSQLVPICSLVSSSLCP